MWFSDRADFPRLQWRQFPPLGAPEVAAAVTGRSRGTNYVSGSTYNAKACSKDSLDNWSEGVQQKITRYTVIRNRSRSRNQQEHRSDGAGEAPGAARHAGAAVAGGEDEEQEEDEEPDACFPWPQDEDDEQEEEEDDEDEDDGDDAGDNDKGGTKK